jgi:hypothetical protein
MKTDTIEYGGYALSASAQQIATGAWVPKIVITKNGAPVDIPEVETVQPEWLTEAEAVRAGIEQARLIVDRWRKPRWP